MKKKYPVGAMWEYIAPDDGGLYGGSIGRVWLAARHVNGREVWWWEWCFKDDKIGNRDWTPSRRLAVEECGARFGGRINQKRKIRFRRVADTET